MSRVAVDSESGEVAGFIIAEKHALRDHQYFQSPEPDSVIYILTIGTQEKFRREGLGTQLMEYIEAWGKADAECGAVCLSFLSLPSFRHLSPLFSGIDIPTCGNFQPVCVVLLLVSRFRFSRSTQRFFLFTLFSLSNLGFHNRLLRYRQSTTRCHLNDEIPK